MLINLISWIKIMWKVRILIQIKIIQDSNKKFCVHIKTAKKPNLTLTFFILYYPIFLKQYLFGNELLIIFFDSSSLFCWSFPSVSIELSFKHI